MTDTGISTAKADLSDAAAGRKRQSQFLRALIIVSITLVSGCSMIEGWLYGPNEPVMPSAGTAPYPPVYQDSYASIPSPDAGVAPVDSAAGTEVFPSMLNDAGQPRSVAGSANNAASYDRLATSLQAQRQNVMDSGVESYAPINYATTNRRFPSGVSDSAPIGQSALPSQTYRAPVQQRLTELPPRTRSSAASSPSLGRAPVTGSGDMIGVQVGAYRILENADRGWTIVVDMYSGMLDNLVPVVVEVDLGVKGTFFRLIATGVQSVASARELCDDLIISGQDWCAVRRM